MGDSDRQMGRGDTFVVDTVGFNQTKAGWISTAIRTVKNMAAPDSSATKARGSQTPLPLQLVNEDPRRHATCGVGYQELQAADGEESVYGRFLCIPEEEDAFTNWIRMPAAGQNPK